MSTNVLSIDQLADVSATLAEKENASSSRTVVSICCISATCVICKLLARSAMRLQWA
jgi:hypothetical protein